MLAVTALAAAGTLGEDHSYRRHPGRENGKTMSAGVKAFREFYAALVVGLTGTGNERVRAAFASVARERFVGPGPWRVHVGNGYVETPSDDPRFLYHDVVVAIAEDRGIHNGAPTLHALCLAECEPKVGESVIHIGAGTGYYSAILAEMVGPAGTVAAFEIEADLAARAAAQLPTVRVLAESAIDAKLPPADVIYVCAGVAFPVASWLDALKIGGRLVFPLTPDAGLGCMLMISREDETRYSARSLADVAFIPCAGARDAAASNALARAFAARPAAAIRSLHRDTHPDGSAWCVGQGWWLSTTDVKP